LKKKKGERPFPAYGAWFCSTKKNHDNGGQGGLKARKKKKKLRGRAPPKSEQEKVRKEPEGELGSKTRINSIYRKNTNRHRVKSPMPSQEPLKRKEKKKEEKKKSRRTL